MADKKRVNLTVNSQTKAEWDNAVEESTKYSSLSDLIRQSVAYELSDSPAPAPRNAEGRNTEQTAQAEAHAEILEQVTDTLDSMETTLSSLDDRLMNVEQEVTATAQADLRNKVFNSLPQADDSETGMSAEQIADDIGADRERVSNVLSKLVDQTGAIQVVGNIEGQQFYARDDDQ